MPLSPSDRAELGRLGADNVRHRLSYAGPSRDAVITSLGPGFGMTRGDVEEWLAEKSQEELQAEARYPVVGESRHLGRRDKHFSDDSTYRLVLHLAGRLKGRRIRYNGRGRHVRSGAATGFQTPWLPPYRCWTRATQRSLTA